MAPLSTQALDDQLRHLAVIEQQNGMTAGTLTPLEPVLRTAASRLQHLHYYVPQNLDQTWLIFTQSNAHTGAKSQVIYAYATLPDAKRGAQMSHVHSDGVVAMPIPVVQILVGLLGLAGLDSVIFMETPGDVWNGQAIQRNELVQAIQPVKP